MKLLPFEHVDLSLLQIGIHINENDLYSFNLIGQVKVKDKSPIILTTVYESDSFEDTVNYAYAVCRTFVYQRFISPIIRLFEKDGTHVEDISFTEFLIHCQQMKDKDGNNESSAKTSKVH